MTRRRLLVMAGIVLAILMYMRLAVVKKQEIAAGNVDLKAVALRQVLLMR